MFYRFYFGVDRLVEAHDIKEARHELYDLIKEELEWRFRDVIEERKEWAEAEKKLKEAK